MKSIIKYNHLGVYILCLLLAFTSCQDNNDPELLFEDTPAVRVKKEIEKLRTTLKSSENGWKVTYFTDDEQLGGYSFLFNFLSDEEVVMDADFGNPDPDKKSLYDITLGSTVKLTFTTKNVIHELSDGANYPDQELRGKGYKGDFEFLLSSYDGDDIVFRVNRNTSNYLRFERASAEDWNNLDKHQTSIDMMKNDPTKSVFRVIKIGDKVYNFSYNSNRRFASASDDSSNSIGFGVAFTPTGITVSPSIDVNGEKVSDFTFDPETSSFVANQGGKEVASIYYVDTPPFPYTGYKDIVKGNLRYNEIPGLSNSSKAFLTFLSDFRNSIAVYGLTLDRIYLRDMQKDVSYVQLYLKFRGRSYRFWFDFTKKIEDDKLFFVPTGDTNAPPAFQAIYQPLLDILFDTKGHYVENSGRLGRYSNGTFKFVPASNTTYKIHFYDF